MDLKLCNYPIILFDKHINIDDRSGKVCRHFVESVKQNEMSVLLSESATDCLESVAFTPNASCVILDWDSFNGQDMSLEKCLEEIRKINNLLPIFIVTQEHELNDAATGLLKENINFFWKYADTYDFTVGRIKTACINYLTGILPPFFKELAKYTEEHKYAWHTPGHMGGVAFLKSPVGHVFYDYYGENTFRSDLSISVPELGSLMEHSGVNGDAERNTAKVFGADYSFYVTNGTSTSNKMVVMSCCGKGDVAIVDRNCHKSLQHALTLANVIPIYFIPTRNAYGIIGTIPLSEFTHDVIKKKVDDCPLIQDKNQLPEIAIVTNSTYDGLIYDVRKIKDTLSETKIPNLHFDEAWYPYAHFHPIYDGKYAMNVYHDNNHPTVYATQSTHKLLAAFSQASMVHVKNGVRPMNVDIFNETFMMHTSTSPQYSIIASLDISTNMMKGQFGKRLVSESIFEAVGFRQEFSKVQKNFHRNRDWFFKLWQPDAIDKIAKSKHHHFLELNKEDDQTWLLKHGDKWHGFNQIDKQYTYLDPIKVTVLTPGINTDATFEETGIPGPIVSKYLMNHGVVDEKTSFYSLLFLFSIGVNKSKAMNLLSDLVSFKECYDANKPIADIFPHLHEEHYERYGGLGLKDVCQQMHDFLKNEDASNLLMKAFDVLPEQVITPNAAYQYIVKNACKAYSLDNLRDKVIVTMLAPYPPGIPVIMPGERITSDTQVIIDYLQMLEKFDNNFPGFENEVHGVEVKQVNSKRTYFVNCIPK